MSAKKKTEAYVVWTWKETDGLHTYKQPIPPPLGPCECCGQARTDYLYVTMPREIPMIAEGVMFSVRVDGDYTWTSRIVDWYPGAASYTVRFS